MKNLEQVRAAAALEFWGRNEGVVGDRGGDVVRGLSSLIINNGLLATSAFAQSKGGGHEQIMREICRFLAEKRGLCDRADSLEGYVRSMCMKDSFVLQRATSEALAYLAYLKRFMPR